MTRIEDNNTRVALSADVSRLSGPTRRMSDNDSARPHNRDGLFRQAIETGRTRLLITGTILALSFATIGVRLVDVTALRMPSESRDIHAARTEPIKTSRSNITDRNGTIVATELRTVSLSANPKHILDAQEAAVKLASVLPDQSASALAKKLSSGRRFVWIQRQLTPLQQWEVNALGIPGLEFHAEESRVYPQGRLLSHILGFTDIDNNGISGIEKEFDKSLRNGDAPLRLSIDTRLQYLMRRELSSAIKEFSAIGGTGLIMDARNGEILSMVSLPDFDPNHPGEANSEALFNRSTLGIYELGSTFKIFNSALALESGVAKLDTEFDASKPLRVARFTINDYHGKNRWLSLAEVFIYSSNIGSAQMVSEVGPVAQKAFMDKLGFLSQVPVELPETGSPLYPKVWRPINMMTISYGHGIAISPLHLAAGVAAMVNGGVMHNPTLIASDEPRKGHRIISKRTSKAVRKLMRLNNIDGSGKKSNAVGYLVGGKTGTAEKVNANGGYARKSLISSYVAAFPMNDPKYIVYVVLDEPHGTKATFGYATGGWVAAPVVSRVVSQMGPMLGIEPVDAEAPEVRQELAIGSPKGGKTLASF